MPSGGLLQLVANTGSSSDVYLTGNPQVTYFKTVYRRHTNFAMETFRNIFLGNTTFGGYTTATIERAADLVYKSYVRVVVSGATAPAGAQWAWVQNLGHALLQNVELQIGGQRVDYHTSDSFHFFKELRVTADQARGYDKLIGNVPELTTLNQSHDSYTLYIPLKFFYDRSIGQALPLIGLQFHDVRINVNFESLNNLLVTSGFAPGLDPGQTLGIKMEASLEVGMVYLDTDERRRFSQLSHELLIDQVQWTGAVGHAFSSANLNKPVNNLLSFTNPVKELIWGLHNGRMANTNGTYQYLWYDPNDVDNMRLIATKRFVLACAQYDQNNNLVLANTSTDTNSILPCPGLTGTPLAIFNRIQAAAVATTPALYNVGILGDLLTMAEISTPVSVLLAGVPGRPPLGDGAPQNDVTVRMPHNFGLYLDGTVNPLDNAKIILNGQERIKSQDAAFFNYVQPYEHHTRTPADGINIYSFAIAPEELQPSGSLNFSRVDTSVLQTMFQDQYLDALGSDSQITIYAYSYNVLRIVSGMAGLAFT